MFIDTHCHLDFPPFNANFNETIDAARQADVMAIIVPAVGISNFNDIAGLTVQFPMVYGAFGLHPIFPHSEEALLLLDKQLSERSQKIVAVGEIGLDKLVDIPIEYQLNLLNAQLNLAKKYALPVILHSRKTHDILYKSLKDSDVPNGGIIHAFSGSYQQAMQFIDLGYMLGVGGTITYLRAHKIRETLARVPLMSLVLETDAPDMPLCGFQGQPNQPTQVAAVFDALCRLRSETPEEIQRQIYLNTQRIFGITF